MTDGQPTIPAPFELPTRVASGAVLGLAAVAGLFAGGWLYCFVLGAVALAALREWHRLVNGGRLARETFGTGLAIIAVEVFVFEGAAPIWPVAAIAAGAALVALSAALRRTGQWWPIAWHAIGAVYIGIPVWALVAMRHDWSRGGAIVGALFVAVWTADSAALVFGRMIGGPRLAPRLSPNKTWSGFIAGILVAGIAEAIYVWILGGDALQGIALGFYLGITGHCGDLFESWVKRLFHAKNTGSLIPGHGGMLDRIDSLLFAAPALAALLYVVGVNAVFGGEF